MEKEPKEILSNWKVSPKTMHRVRIQCAIEQISQSELGEKALNAYLKEIKGGNEPRSGV